MKVSTMDDNAQAMIGILISREIDTEDNTFDKRKHSTAYALTRGIQILEQLGREISIPFTVPTPDGEGGLYLSWDCESANVTIHIYATPEGGFVKTWIDENESIQEMVPSKDYIYYDFTEYDLTPLECGADENLSIGNIVYYLKHFMDANGN